MGDFTLGQLIGQHQSFDPNIGSWENLDSNICSFDLQTTDVHSSKQGSVIEIESFDNNTALVRYQYSPNKFTDITTHSINISLWAKLSGGAGTEFIYDVASSGNTQNLDNTNLILYQNSYAVTNSIQLTFSHSATGTINILFLDDILVELDRQILHPDWSYIEQQQNIENKQVSIGGKSEYFKYGELFRWQIPLTFMPNSQAELINFWWEEKENLLFSPDTSNSNLKYITRIVHKPFTNFTHNNRMNGVIELESITNGLVF